MAEGMQRYAPNFIDTKYPGQEMMPLGSGNWLKRDDLIVALTADWTQACSGMRNPVVCETCRAYEAVLYLLGVEVDE